jgi:hypothetical protein
MSKNWIGLLSLLSLPLGWMGASASSYGLQKPESAVAILMSRSMPPLHQMSVQFNPASQRPTATLAQSSQRPVTNFAAQGFRDFLVVPNWVTDSKVDEGRDLRSVGLLYILPPGPVQIELTSVLKNYQIWAKLSLYDKMYDPQFERDCVMYLNPPSGSPPCVIDRTRPVEVVINTKWMGGPKPKKVYTAGKVKPFDGFMNLYYMNGKPLYVTIRNAKEEGRFQFPASPKPKEEDTRRCWRGITGVVSCW